jgi:hypothetical protein
LLQYFDGEGKIIFPPEWPEQTPTPKPWRRRGVIS